MYQFCTVKGEFAVRTIQIEAVRGRAVILAKNSGITYGAFLSLLRAR
jgi:hypothetical protein